MIDVPNLRENFTQFLALASEQDIMRLLDCLVERLTVACPPAARHCQLALDAVYSRVSAHRARRQFPDNLSPLPPHEGAGGERPKS